MVVVSDTVETRVRARLWSSLSPELAAFLGISIGDLQQAAIGRRYLEPDQLIALARHFGIRECAQ
jgi:hypothetical protein